MPKKNKKRKISILSEIDTTLNNTYDNIIEEVQDMQLQLFEAEEKARKKAKKKIKKDPNYFGNSEERLNARKEIIQRIEGDSLLERIERSFKDIAPIVIIIARLVASFILAILSFEPIKLHIRPETLRKLQSVYETALRIGK